MYSQYIHEESIIHNLSAAIKLTGFAGYVLLCLLVHNLVAAVIYLTLAGVLLYLSRLPLKKVIQRMRYILILLIVGLVFNLFFLSWDDALVIFLRLLAIVTVSQVLVLSTTPEDLIAALEKNFKMKREHAVSMLIAIAFLPILESSWQEIARTQSARGYDFSESTLPEKIKGLHAILIPLFRFSLQKAVVLGEALTVKGYNRE